MNVKDFILGQTAYYNGVAATVIHVGTKYVTVSVNGLKIRFKQSDNKKVSYLVEDKTWGSPSLLFATKKAYLDYKEMGDLQQWFRKVNVRDLSLEQLRKIYKVVNGGGLIKNVTEI